jgi:hypothetical protein
VINACQLGRRCLSPACRKAPAVRVFIIAAIIFLLTVTIVCAWEIVHLLTTSPT